MNYFTLHLDLPVNSRLSDDYLLSQISQGQLNLLHQGFVTYIYYNLKKKTVYIGESKQFVERHNQHLQESDEYFKSGQFNKCLVIFNAEVFTESHIKDLEYLLINHMFGEIDQTKFKIMNRNNGQFQPDYQGSEEMSQSVLFNLWQKELYDCSLVHNKDLTDVKQSILFKYSPFTTLTAKQKNIEDEIITSMRSNYVVRGSAGTGQTVLLMSLAFRLIQEYPEIKVGLITTGNLIKKFNGIVRQLGLQKQLKFVRANDLISKANKEGKVYDIVLVDEAHRLQRYYTRGHGMGKLHFKELGIDKNEIELLKQFSKQLILFYDEFQSIRPQDIPVSDYTKAIVDFEMRDLDLQFRIQGLKGDQQFSGKDYINGLKSILGIDKRLTFNPDVFKNSNPDSYFGVVDSVQELFEYVDTCYGMYPNTTNRVLAGYTKPWTSNGRAPQNKGLSRDEMPFEWGVYRKISGK